MTWIKILSEFHVLIFNTFWEISRQRASRSDRLIVLNDLARPKMAIIFFRLLLKIKEVSSFVIAFFASMSRITKMKYVAQDLKFNYELPEAGQTICRVKTTPGNALFLVSVSLLLTTSCQRRATRSVGLRPPLATPCSWWACFFILFFYN